MAQKGLASISELHKLTGLDRETISKRLDAAGMVPNLTSRNAKRYEVEAALRALESTATDGEAAKRRKWVADAEKAEINVQVLLGKLVPIEEMRKAAGELVKTLYQRIVRVEPGILAGQCVGKNATEIETAIHDAMAKVFSDLRTMPEKFLSVELDEQGDGDSQSTGSSE